MSGAGVAGYLGCAVADVVVAVGGGDYKGRRWIGHGRKCPTDPLRWTARGMVLFFPQKGMDEEKCLNLKISVNQFSAGLEIENEHDLEKIAYLMLY